MARQIVLADTEMPQGRVRSDRYRAVRGVLTDAVKPLQHTVLGEAQGGCEGTPPRIGWLSALQSEAPRWGDDGV